jgi:hypothetical protein
MIRGANGKLTSAAALVTISEQGGESELKRENLRQMAILTARLEGRDLGGAVKAVNTMMQSVTLPPGYTYEIGGQYQSQQQAFRELLLVAGIATSLVFVVLVIQFRRFTQAVLILAAAPLSLCGAFALLTVTGTDLNVSSAMGLILLVGLVVKNGIVLLDFADRRYSEGMPIVEAVLAAAHAPAADSDDDAVHAVRAVAARARTRGWRRAAEAARARRHRRAEPVNARDAIPRAVGLRSPGRTPTACLRIITMEGRGGPWRLVVRQLSEALISTAAPPQDQ